MTHTTARLSMQWKVWAALALLMILSGCATLQGGGASAPEKTLKKSDTGPLPSDFGDIRLPRALKPVKDQTFFMNTGDFSAGVISLRGRVDGHSLVTFFESQMQKDNWRIVGFFKSLRSLMMFYKENRWCVISITEKDFFTYVEIWVAPTLHPLDAGLIN
ncbi:MAG TPA: hypothetical protein ENF48_07365 [Desulfobacteraceae bacterium]|nr:hypothetical protein [Deltaproteobacteria bacterium]HDI60153.1 hypothetical protein [Desulfobacteraceae bacterium]